MKKINYILALAVVVFGFSAAVFTATPVAATTQTETCTVKAVGKKNTAGNPDSRFVLNGDNTVTAVFEVKGNEDCKLEVTLASWQAPDADKGRPYDQQKLFKFVTGTFGVGTHKLTVALPDCFYQVDLVRGSKPTGIDGGPVYEQGRMMGSLHGGTKVCEPPKPPEEPKEKPKELPKTGPASILGLFTGTAIAGGAAHKVVLRHRARRG
jgi:hypothetical protein